MSTSVLMGFRFDIQILLCLLPFLWFCFRRKGFVWKAVLSFVVFAGVCTAINFLVDALENVNAYSFFGLYFFLICILLIGCIMFPLRLDFKQGVYLVTAAYALQHICFSLSALLMMILRWNNIALPTALSGFLSNYLLYLAGAIAAGLIFFRSGHRGDFFLEWDIRKMILSIVIVFICVELSIVASSTYFDDPGYLRLRIVTHLYAVVSCALALSLMFGFSRENTLERENQLIEQMLHMEKEQHALSKETIDIINVKCHDLKQRVSLLESLDDKGERQKVIDDLKKNIAIYKSLAQTGNDALDLVLTEKGLFCESNHIQLSYIIDGKQLEFMRATDIASLFGNALDNAIESVLHESEEKRFISLHVKAENGFVYLHIDNYCGNQLEFEDGLPKTTKEEVRYHGFGTKSVRYIAEKYGGEVYMQVKNDRFNLDILFPDQTKKM